MNSLLNDYMFYESNMSEKHIKANIDKLNCHEDIKFELYETIVYNKFPVAGAIQVHGYTAEELNKSTHLSILGSYNYLIYLREDKMNALSDLEKGLLTEV